MTLPRVLADLPVFPAIAEMTRDLVEFVAMGLDQGCTA